MTNITDKVERSINDFAKRSFRDMADRDYLAARLALRAHLFPQALWSAQQALEKYLKYILLVNRIPASQIGHDINAALKLLPQLTFVVELSKPSREFVQHVADFGMNRYLENSYFVSGHTLLELDRAVWDLRRHCQILDVFGKALPAVEQQLLAKAKRELDGSASRHPSLFRLHGGLLEEILDNKKHPSRAALIWQNAYFSPRVRRTVAMEMNVHFSNAPLYLFPEMLDELLKFIYLPKPLAASYRKHLEEIQADPSKRP